MNKVELSELKNGDRVWIVYVKGVNNWVHSDTKNNEFVFMNGKLAHESDVKQDGNGNWVTDFTGDCVAHCFSKKFSHFERSSK